MVKKNQSIDPRASRRMSIKDVAAFFGVHRNTVNRWVRDGTLPAVYLPSGTISHIPASAVERFRKDFED